MRLIDADALCDAMYHEAFENDVSYDERNPMARWDSGLWIRYKMFEKCLENTPTIDAADRPQGEWIDEGNEWVCSNCGVECYVDEDYRPKDERPMQMNYCHYCGADMRGEKDD